MFSLLFLTNVFCYFQGGNSPTTSGVNSEAPTCRENVPDGGASGLGVTVTPDTLNLSNKFE